MKRITALIVDDEPSAIRTLKAILAQHCPQVSIVAEATSIEAALEAVARFDPDLVFLDIEMPPKDKGFDLLRLTPGHRFGVVFTTAYAQYAVQAINEAQPWGYVVKPYRVADLQKAVKFSQEKMVAAFSQVVEKQGLIVPDLRKGHQIIPTVDILYCQADGGSTDIFYQQNGRLERVVSSKSLREVQDDLPGTMFFRAHRSYLVNLHFIVRYKRTGRNGVAYLKHGCQVGIAVNRLEEFEERLKGCLAGNS